MSSGSYGNTGRPEDGIGTKPMHMGAWEKLQLGWLNYEAYAPRRRRPASSSARRRPTPSRPRPSSPSCREKKYTVTIGTPRTGADFWYSGQGNDIDNNMLTALPAGATALSAYVKTNIERDWDYAYAVYSTDGGKTFTSHPDEPVDDDEPERPELRQRDHRQPHAVDAADGEPDRRPAGALVGFRYWTDGATVGTGLSVDDVDDRRHPGDRVDPQGLHDDHRLDPEVGVQRLHRRVPPVPRLRRDAARPVRTTSATRRRPDWAERFAVPGRPAGHVLERAVQRQQRRRPPGRRPDPAGRRPPGADLRAHGRRGRRPDQRRVAGVRGSSPTTRPSGWRRPTGSRCTTRTPASPARTAASPRCRPSTTPRTGTWPSGEQPDANGWAGVDVPKTGTKIRVVSTTQGGFMQVQLN